MNLINQRKIEAEIASALIKGFEQEVGSEKALEIEFLEETSDKLFFKVKRCRYAEAYKASGLSNATGY